ncbi:MAG: efflux RND transporter periplasmic adaptor subunit [Thiomicrorhabdus chilensis]|uniref:efflux RND transporter periplasmic adaptor subunit n=1 Tax=Thiomicrorhabdus chilensis TaxID=63656 RepID=UPI00299D3592|nr:efflux RND transporter periplasmic adaptor subunit [Thiomicrorhabdus chilensis]MDX1348404.1 efflux RND transporter periplasmic adaptor subunit [Thiomicrorhabdus chilensis]
MQTNQYLNQLNQSFKKNLGLTAMSVALWIGGTLPLAAADIIALDNTQQEAMGFQFSPLERVTEVRSYAYPATLSLPEPHQQMLTAPMDGLVTQVFRVHGSVSEGEPVIELLSSDMLKSQKEYLTTLSELKVVQQELKRARSLVQSGVVSKKQLQATESRMNSLNQQAQQQQQDLQLMGMSDAAIGELKRSNRLQPALLTIKAPDNGELFDLTVKKGMRLTMNQPIAKFAELDKLVAEVFVPINESRKLKLGQKVRIQAESAEGKIAYISHQADPMTQSVEIHCVFPNANGNLISGALQSVEFISELPQQAAFKVPQTAVIEANGQTVIFLRKQGEKASLMMQAVTRIEQPGQMAVVIPLEQASGTLNFDQWQVMTRGAVAMLSVLSAGEGEE